MRVTRSGPNRRNMRGGTRHTGTRRAQRRDAREHRVRAGAPSIRHDWRCHICGQWYSNYRGRNAIHLKFCKKRRAERIALDKRRQLLMQAPLPTPDSFTRASTPDPALPGPSWTLQSPTREPSIGMQEYNQPEDQLELGPGDGNPGDVAQ